MPPRFFSDKPPKKFTIKEQIAILKTFVHYYPKHKKLLVLDMIFVVLTPLFSTALPVIVYNAFQTYLPQKNIRMLICCLLGILCLTVFNIISNYIKTRFGHTLGVRMEADMRTDLFTHLQKLSFSYFDKTKTGHIMSKITNDLTMIAEVAHHCPEDIISAILMLIGGLTVMICINPLLTLLTLLPIPFMILWGTKFLPKMKQCFRDVRKEVADINSQVENAIQGVREVKFVHGANQTGVALLNQIKNVQTAAGILLCDGNHKAQVCLCQLILCFLVALGNALCQLHFFLCRQQLDLTDFLQVHSHRVIQIILSGQIHRVNQLFLRQVHQIYIHIQIQRVNIVRQVQIQLCAEDLNIHRLKAVVNFFDFFSCQLHLLQQSVQLCGTNHPVLPATGNHGLQLGLQFLRAFGRCFFRCAHKIPLISLPIVSNAHRLYTDFSVLTRVFPKNNFISLAFGVFCRSLPKFSPFFRKTYGLLFGENSV